MSQIRLYIDEDFNRCGLVLSLQDRGIDVITTLSANRLRCTDEQQLMWATERAYYSLAERTRKALSLALAQHLTESL